MGKTKHKRPKIKQHQDLMVDKRYAQKVERLQRNKRRERLAQSAIDYYDLFTSGGDEDR